MGMATDDPKPDSTFSGAGSFGDRRVAPPRSRSFFPVVLLLVALLEFFFGRLLGPLFRGQSGAFAAAVEIGSRFSQNLAAVLVLVSVAALLLQAVAAGGVAPNPVGRVGLSIMGTVFVSSAAMLVLIPDWLSAQVSLLRVQWLAQTTTVCLAVLIVVSMVPQLSRRTAERLGLLFLILPPLIQLETQWGVFSSKGLLPHFTLLFMVFGPVVAAAALGVGAMLVAPLRVLRGPAGVIPIGISLVIAMCMVALLFVDRAAAARLIFLVFDLRLPAALLAQAAYVLSLFLFALAVGAMLLGQAEREATDGRSSFFGLGSDASGLLLIGLAGCQSRTIYQIGYYLTGLLCLSDSLLRRRPRLEPSSAASANRDEKSADAAE